LTDDEAEANRFLKIIGEMEKNYTTSNKVIPENPAHKDTTKSSSRK
jgi:hypothetical protein